jgi:hypothetical protein
MPQVKLENGEVLTVITKDFAKVRSAIKESGKKAVCVLCEKPIEDYVDYTYYPRGLMNPCHKECGEKVLKEKLSV